jgi:hypothetical protein
MMLNTIRALGELRGRTEPERRALVAQLREDTGLTALEEGPQRRLAGLVYGAHKHSYVKGPERAAFRAKVLDMFEVPRLRRPCVVLFGLDDKEKSALEAYLRKPSGPFAGRPRRAYRVLNIPSECAELSLGRTADVVKHFKQGRYPVDHLCFVKAADQFTAAELALWASFRRTFQGLEKYFVVIGTQAMPGWTYTNRKNYAAWSAKQGLSEMPVFELHNRPLRDAAGCTVVAEGPEAIDRAVAAEGPEAVDRAVAAEGPEAVDRAVAAEGPEAVDRAVAAEGHEAADRAVDTEGAQNIEVESGSSLSFTLSASQLDDGLALLRQPFWRHPVDLLQGQHTLQAGNASWLKSLRLR